MELICIVCPIGCRIRAEAADGKVTRVTGNRCPRGAEYARTECIRPVRTLTTTVRTEGGGLVPVKSDKPLPKQELMRYMKILNGLCLKRPVTRGEIVYHNIDGQGGNIIATDGLKEESYENPGT